MANRLVSGTLIFAVALVGTLLLAACGNGDTESVPQAPIVRSSGDSDGSAPDSRSFPRRNRLISGISLGTLVVEAGETSGARWTVRHALDQNREVFCVSGSIYSPASRLTNRLIQEGAKLVCDHNDVLEELNLSVVTHQIEMRLAQDLHPDAPDDEESNLLNFLEHEPLHIDDIRRRAGIPITQVSGILTMLELKGLVKPVGCMHYVRMREANPVYGN